MFLLAVLAARGAFAAGPDPSRAQISAATANALAALRSEIDNLRISPQMNLGQFLEQTKSADILEDVIQHAQQIGEPRWIDDQTCQVKLELAGSKVAYAVVSVAATRTSPIPAGVLEQRLSGVKDRTFSGTGTSVAATQLANLRPVDAGDGWNSVTDRQRDAAIAAARSDASVHLLADIAALPDGQSSAVSTMLNRAAVRKATDDWLRGRPVTAVRFKDNRQVELTIATPTDDLFDTIVTAARNDGQTIDERALSKLRSECGSRISAETGRASVDAGTAAAPSAALPAAPPAWTAAPIDAEGEAAHTTSPLRTKSQAEAIATDALRAKIGQLALGDRRSIDDVGRADSRIVSAVNSALLHAHVYKVEIHADGSVKVRITLDTRDLWTEVQQAIGQ